MYHAGIQKTFQPVRPNLCDFDISYNNKYQSNWDATHDFKVDNNRIERTSYDADHVYIDCIYYPGVIDHLQSTINT